MKKQIRPAPLLAAAILALSLLAGCADKKGVQDDDPVVASYGETEIHVAIRRRLLAGKDGVEIIVMDNGNGYPEEYIAQFNGGVYEDTRRIGLQNARMRLRYLYGDAIIFRIGNRLEGGARTYIWIPNGKGEEK